MVIDLNGIFARSVGGDDWMTWLLYAVVGGIVLFDLIRKK
jgi:hypothetical protein